MVVISCDCSAEDLASAIQGRGFEIKTTSCEVEELNIALNEYFVDVVVLDLDSLNGLSLLEWLHRQHPAVRVVVLVRESTEEKAVFCVGKASGYLRYPIDKRRFASIVTQLVTIIGAGEISVDLRRRQAFFRDRLIKLTNIRYKILVELVKNADKPLTYAELALAIYNEDMTNEQATNKLKTHVQYLHEDLEKATGKQIISRRAGEVFWINK